MKTRIFFGISGLFALILFHNSCTQDSDPILESTVKKTVMREVSALANLMFKMEGDLKLIRAGLITDSTLSPLEPMSYEGIFTAETSKDVRRDSVFVIHGTAYLSQIQQLIQARSRDSALFYFNNTIDACVTCHKSHCPGPVARIQKLKI